MSSIQRLHKSASIMQGLLQMAPRLRHLRHQIEDLLPGRSGCGGHTYGLGLNTQGRRAPRAPAHKERRKG
jgi:hypothetical protein